MEQDILAMARTYFNTIGEDISDDVLLLMIQSLIDYYKTMRNYPTDYTDDMIEADVERYFGIRKTNIAMSVLPEVYGRFGAEKLSMLTDAGTTRMWSSVPLMNDIVSICEVV